MVAVPQDWITSNTSAPVLQFRVVSDGGATTGACRGGGPGYAPAPPEEMCRQFTAYRCPASGGGTAAPAAEWLVACDPSGVVYLLAPASFESAVASAKRYQSPTDVWPLVQYALPPDAVGPLASLTANMVGTPQQLAIVLGPSVLTAPTINAVITDGKSEIAGDMTDQEADALVDSLTGRSG